MKKKISEVVELKIKNINLALQIIDMQAKQYLAERQRLLVEEFKRLKCSPKNWTLNNITWELEKRK